LKKRTYKGYTSNDMKQAVQQVQEGNFSVNKASTTYKIPRATLISHLQNGSLKKKPGPSTLLSVEEDKLISDWILDCAQKGSPRRKADIVNAAQSILRNKRKDREITLSELSQTKPKHYGQET
jgi:hypothetical protein